jgi:hypothetical protein
MRGRIDVIEALEEIIKTRAGTVLLKDGGKHTNQKLMKGQEEFSSQVFAREYSIAVGKQRARVFFRYDYRAEGCNASLFINLSDIILIKNNAKDLDRMLGAVRGNGTQEFPIVRVEADGAIIDMKGEKT